MEAVSFSATIGELADVCPAFFMNEEFSDWDPPFTNRLRFNVPVIMSAEIDIPPDEDGGDSELGYDEAYDLLSEAEYTWEIEGAGLGGGADAYQEIIADAACGFDKPSSGMDSDNMGYGDVVRIEVIERIAGPMSGLDIEAISWEEVPVAVSGVLNENDLDSIASSVLFGAALFDSFPSEYQYDFAKGEIGPVTLGK